MITARSHNLGESKRARRERWAAGDYSGRSRLDRIFRIVLSVPIGCQFDLLYVLDQIPSQQRTAAEVAQTIVRSPFAVLVGRCRYERVHSSSPFMREPSAWVTDELQELWIR